MAVEKDRTTIHQTEPPMSDASSDSDENMVADTVNAHDRTKQTKQCALHPLSINPIPLCAGELCHSGMNMHEACHLYMVRPLTVHELRSYAGINYNR